MRVWVGAVAWLALAGLPAGARTLEVGPGLAYATPSAAAAAARDGDRILIAPGDYRDCAVLHASGLIIAGADPAHRPVLTGPVCQRKALLVVQGDGVTVRDLVLAGASGPDGNEAGLRAEGDGLTVERVVFRANRNGILAGARPRSVITVRDSDFIGNGACIGDCSHAIYAGRIASLVIEGSRFRDTREGHHVKSRARRTEITGCAIEDGPDGTASYLIDIPDGGSLVLRNATLEKGPRTQNPAAAIILGEESAAQATGEISITGNRFRRDGPATVFVDNRTATPARLAGNALSGPVTALRGPGSVE